jgi:hypothetical protein
MSEKEKQGSNMPDAKLAADERPVPSQAEGDLDTIEQDLEEKSESKSSTAGTGGRK